MHNESYTANQNQQAAWQQQNSQQNYFPPHGNHPGTGYDVFYSNMEDIAIMDHLQTNQSTGGVNQQQVNQLTNQFEEWGSNIGGPASQRTSQDPLKILMESTESPYDARPISREIDYFNPTLDLNNLRPTDHCNMMSQNVQANYNQAAKENKLRGDFSNPSEEPSEGTYNNNEKSENDQQNKQEKGNGRWTEQEHQDFLDALRLYGKDWNKVHGHIGSRTSAQTRSHAQKFFKKISKRGRMEYQDLYETLMKKSDPRSSLIIEVDESMSEASEPKVCTPLSKTKCIQKSYSHQMQRKNRLKSSHELDKQIMSPKSGGAFSFKQLKKISSITPKGLSQPAAPIFQTSTSVSDNKSGGQVHKIFEVTKFQNLGKQRANSDYSVQQLHFGLEPFYYENKQLNDMQQIDEEELETINNWKRSMLSQDKDRTSNDILGVEGHFMFRKSKEFQPTASNHQSGQHATDHDQMIINNNYDKLLFNMPDEIYGLSAEMHNHQNRVTSEFCIDSKEAVMIHQQKPNSQFPFTTQSQENSITLIEPTAYLQSETEQNFFHLNNRNSGEAISLNRSNEKQFPLASSYNSRKNNRMGVCILSSEVKVESQFQNHPHLTQQIDDGDLLMSIPADMNTYMSAPTTNQSILLSNMKNKDRDSFMN